MNGHNNDFDAVAVNITSGDSCLRTRFKIFFFFFNYGSCIIYSNTEYDGAGGVLDFYFQFDHSRKAYSFQQ